MHLTLACRHLSRATSVTLAKADSESLKCRPRRQAPCATRRRLSPWASVRAEPPSLVSAA